MLFKRSIFETQKPTVLFFTEDKTGASFSEGKCFPVFGPDRPWVQVLKSYPLAIAVGYQKTSVAKLRQRFNAHKEYRYFDLNYATQTDPSRHCGILIIANEAFMKLFPIE